MTVVSGQPQSVFIWLSTNVQRRLIEPWFKYLEFLLIVTAVDAAAKATESLVLVFLSVISSAALSLWAMNEVTHVLLDGLHETGHLDVRRKDFSFWLRMVVIGGAGFCSFVLSRYTTAVIAPMIVAATR